MKTRASWPMKDWEVQAIQEGRKTQHRMPVKQKLTPLAEGSNWYQFDHCGPNYRVNARHTTVGAFAQLLQFHPHGQPGDRLWVREATHRRSMLHLLTGESLDKKYDGAAYTADGKPVLTQEGFDFAWWTSHKSCPANHMPEWVSRITLEIVGVRVERLQDITEADALAEGVDPGAVAAFARVAGVTRPAGFAYRDIVESEHPGAWDANDLVWVREFKRVAQKGGAND